MTTITIENCNTCRVDGPRKKMNQLFMAWRKPHPNRYHIMLRQRGRNKWDGYINYLSERGTFKIGLMPKVRETLIAMGEEVEIIDLRPRLKVQPIVPKHLGDRTLYPDQRKALGNLLSNKVGDTPFLICAGDYSVGFGKSTLFCAIHKAFKSKLRTILLLKDADLFKQFKRELPPMLPDETITFVQGGNVDNWANFTVAMVPSLAQNIKRYQRYLAMAEIVLIDEADVIDNASFRTVISQLWNSVIRIGLSGTIYMSALKKKEVHNLNIMQFIGPKVDEVRLKSQMDKGRATPVVIKMVEAATTPVKDDLDYTEEYKRVIVENPEAYEIMLERFKYNEYYDRFPMLIVTKFIPHCEAIYKYLKDKVGHKYRIAYIHNDVKNREKVLLDTKEGKIDILISTLIISRGKNIPQLKYIMNLASMDSQEQTIQVLGRLVRKFMDKSKGYLDDLHFRGKYLNRHGNHRKNYYLKEKLKVIRVKQSPTTRTYQKKATRRTSTRVQR